MNKVWLMMAHGSVGILAILCLGGAADPCPNEGAASTNAKKACCDCPSWAGRAKDAACGPYSMADCLIFCDCAKGYRCLGTGVTTGEADVWLMTGDVQDPAICAESNGSTCEGGCVGGHEGVHHISQGEYKESRECAQPHP